MFLSSVTTALAITVLPVLQGGGGMMPEPPDPARSAMAVRASQAPTIDGSDSDLAWAMARPISDFLQFDPSPGTQPSFRTEFKVAFDDRNLFVFVRAFDPHPDSIMRALSRRDVRGPSDQIKLLIDSYNDNRSGFEFAVNPDGVKRDYAVYNDGEEDISWNGIWDVETRVDSLGWTAEFRIPLSQLRYADAPSHTFGFGVWRDIERYKERVSWPEYVVTKQGFISQMGDLHGIDGIRAPGTLELTPYAVTKNLTRQTGNGGFEHVQEVALGGDLKWGITPNVTLDATINPDFGQVEADPAVLNLSAFETFLRERRPFFVEGTGLYQFRLNCYIVVDCSTNEGLFYSRRIGRSPQLSGRYGDHATPTATPIAAATKLTGRTRGGLSFGLLDAVTPRVEGSDGRTVEPTTNYAVLRATQDLRGGNMGIGWIATAVNRSLDGWSEPYLHRSAYVTGASFRNRFLGGKYELAASLAASRVEGTRQVIDATQRNAVHYYQQPDDELEPDSATSLTGYAGQIKFGKYGGGITRFESSLVRQSAGFEVNDLGYLRRADQTNWSTWAALSFREARGIYRWAQVNGNHWEAWNTSGVRLENAFNFNGHIGLKNNWNAHAGSTIDGLGKSFCDRCTRGGPLVRKSRGIYPWFGVNGDDRKRLIPSMWVNLGFSDEGNSSYTYLSPSVSLKVSDRLQASLGAEFGREDKNAQWFDNFTDSLGTTHFTFARLDQRTVSMNMRINYTARPNLTFEFYGQPFAASGSYANLREVSATPDADRFADRYQPYTPTEEVDLDFKYVQLRTNSVIRWEYRPGSTLFLVWAHGRQGSPGQQGASWRDDYRDLFGLHPDNTFLIKVAHWFSR